MILVTGAAGFIGPHVVESLSGELSPGPLRVLLRRADADFSGRFPDVETVVGDLDDLDALRAATRGVSAIVHLASKNVDHDGRGFDVNVDGTRRLCDAAIEAGARRFVYVSSVGVYGHGVRRGVDERTPVRPDTPFSISKAAAERIVLDHHRKGTLSSVVLRHRFVYGEGDEAVLPRLIRAARRYPFWIAGGRARLSFVWVKDLAEVVRRFLTDDRTSEGDPVFHVTSGEALPYRSLIETICSTFDYRPPRFSVPLWPILTPLLLRESIRRLDPETVTGLSSLRVKMIAQDNYFSNHRLLERFPDLELAPFARGFGESVDYYRRFA